MAHDDRPHHKHKHHHRAGAHKHEHPMVLLLKVAKNADDRTAYSFQKHGPSTTTEKALQDKDFVLLFFGGHWCGSCREFAPDLQQFYHQAKKNPNVSLEVIYVSADRDTGEFHNAYKQMPWLAMDFQNSHSRGSLTRKCHANTIPRVVVMDAQTGYFITDQGRKEITQAMQKNVHSSGEGLEWLLQKWRTTEAVPLKEAHFSGSGCVIL